MWEPVNVEPAMATNLNGETFSSEVNQSNGMQSEASQASGKAKILTPEARDSYVTVRSAYCTLCMVLWFIDI